MCVISFSKSGQHPLMWSQTNERAPPCLVHKTTTLSHTNQNIAFELPTEYMLIHTTGNNLQGMLCLWAQGYVIASYAHSSTMCIGHAALMFFMLCLYDFKFIY